MARHAHGGPDSWRRKAAVTGEAHARQRLVRRWVITLLAVALVACFVFVALQLRPSRTLVAVLPIREYAEEVPLNPYAADDDPLQALESEVKSISYKVWAPYQSSAAGGIEGRRIVEQLNDWSPTSRDAFVLYVSAHGVARDGIPYLLYDAFELNSESWQNLPAVVAVDKIFEQLNSCPAQVKLVILDAGRIAHDTRLGVLFNDFPRRIADTVSALGDRQLYVLLSHSSFESTDGVESLLPSPFAHFVARALSGEADLDQTKQLTLAELYRFVWNQSLAAFGDDPDYRQTPILLQGGAGVVHADSPELAKAILVRGLSGRKKPQANAEDEQAEDEPADEPATGAEAKQAVSWRRPHAGLAWLQPAGDSSDKDAAGETGESQPASGTDAASPADAANPPAEAPDAAEAEDTPAEQDEQQSPAVVDPLLAALDTIWRARQPMVNRERAFWSPIDIAPHVWRQVEYDLLRFERQCRINRADPNLVREAQRFAQDLNKLHGFLARSAPRLPRFSPGELGNELRQIAAQAQEYATAREIPENARVARDSVALLDRVARVHSTALYLVPACLKWQALARVDPDDGQPHYQRTEELITRFFTSLSGLRQNLQRLASQSRVNPISPFQESRLLSLLDALRDAEDAVGAQIKREIDQAIQANGYVAEKRRSALLQLPLLTADQRQLLLKSMFAAQPPEVQVSDYLIPTTVDVTFAEDEQWNRVEALAKLEIAAVKFADPTTARQLEGKLSRTKRDPWTQFAELGQQLAAWYGQLPERLTPEPPNQQDDDPAQLLLSLVDPRDRARIPESIRPGPGYRVPPRPARPQLRFVEDVRELQLAEQARPFTVSFQAQEVFTTVRFAVDFPDQQVAVRYGGEELGSNEWVSLRPTDAQRQQVPLELRAKTSQPEQVPLPTLLVRLRTDGVEGISSVIRYRLPLPNRIDLLVRRHGSTGTWGASDEVVSLRCFPNGAQPQNPRTTEFDLLLRNHSGVAKTILVQLIKLPDITGRSWAPGLVGRIGRGVDRRTWNAVFVNGQLEQGLRPTLLSQVLAEAEVQLTEDQSEEPVRFAAPGAGKEGEDSAKPADAADQAVDVSHGLLCLLTNKDDPQERSAKWLDLQPLHPRDYATAEARYADGKIVVEVDLKGDRDIDRDGKPDRPPWTEELPGTIVWEGESPNADISTGDGVVLRSGGVEANGQWEWVWLTIDGYPRAFAWKVQCRANGEREDYTIGSLSSSKIMHITAVFPPGSGDGEARKPETQKVSGDSRIVFPPCQWLRVGFAVDVPTNKFVGDYTDDDGIQLTVDQEAKKGPYFSDRLVRTMLVSSAGTLSFVSTVADYEVQLGAAVLNDELILEAQLPANCPLEQPHQVQLFIDSKPPEVRRGFSTVPDRIAQGTPLKAVFAVSDAGGLAALEYGIDIMVPPGLDPGDQPLFDPLRGLSQNAAITLPTDGLTIGRSYKLIARVHDLAGNRQEASFSFAVLPPLAQPVEVQRGIIFGEVLDYRGRRVAGPKWKLTIRGPDVNLSIPHNGAAGQAMFKEGEFRFGQLDPGAYELEVTNNDRAYPKGDKKEGLQPAPPDKARAVVLEATKANWDNFND